MKGNVKASKSFAVGGASLASQMLIAAPINSAISGAAGYDIPYIMDLLSETLGIGIMLSAFELAGAISQSDAELDGERKKKRSAFAKGFMLAGVDVLGAELLQLVLGDSILLAGDPAANSQPMGSSTPTKTYTKPTVKPAVMYTK